MIIPRRGLVGSVWCSWSFHFWYLWSVIDLRNDILKAFQQKFLLRSYGNLATLGWNVWQPMIPWIIHLKVPTSLILFYFWCYALPSRERTYPTKLENEHHLQMKVPFLAWEMWWFDRGRGLDGGWRGQPKSFSRDTGIPHPKVFHSEFTNPWKVTVETQ